jgi:hypothetical protein
MRVASDRPSTGKAGGWLHKLAAPATGQTIQHKKPTPKLNPEQLAQIEGIIKLALPETSK